MSTRVKFAICAGFLAVVVLGLVFLYFNNPNLPDSRMPDCLFYKATSLYCPGCGTTRAVYALLHLELGNAFRNNAFMFFFIPLVLLSFKYKKISYSRWYPILLFVLMLGSVVVRNIGRLV